MSGDDGLESAGDAPDTLLLISCPKCDYRRTTEDPSATRVRVGGEKCPECGHHYGREAIVARYQNEESVRGLLDEISLFTNLPVCDTCHAQYRRYRPNSVDGMKCENIHCDGTIESMEFVSKKALRRRLGVDAPEDGQGDGREERSSGHNHRGDSGMSSGATDPADADNQFQVRRRAFNMIRVVEPETGYVAYWNQVTGKLFEQPDVGRLLQNQEARNAVAAENSCICGQCVECNLHGGRARDAASSETPTDGGNE